MKTLIFVLILLQGGFRLAAQAASEVFNSSGKDSIIAEVSSDNLLISGVPDTSILKEETKISRQPLLLLRESDMLMRLSVLPIYTWSDSVRHISPLPQDFFKIFETGANDKSIPVTDAVGVSLAGVKALWMDMKRYDLALVDLQKNNEELSRKSRSLERVVDRQRKEMELLKRQMQDIINRLPR
jgi:hypothetical protein